MEASLRFSCGHGLLPARFVAATADLVGWNSRRPRCAAACVPFIVSGDTRGARGALAGVWAAPVGTVFEEENHPIFVEAREVTRRGRGTNRWKRRVLSFRSGQE